MNEPNFPPGWDADRVKRLAEYYEQLSEDEQAAEDELAARQLAGKAPNIHPQRDD